MQTLELIQTQVLDLIAVIIALKFAPVFFVFKWSIGRVIFVVVSHV